MEPLRAKKPTRNDKKVSSAYRMYSDMFNNEEDDAWMFRRYM